MCCPLVFEFSVGIGGFVIGLGQISFFFSLYGRLQVFIVLFIATSYHARECFHFVVYAVL